jgi:O-acetylserine/cysteine efflux transporter
MVPVVGIASSWLLLGERADLVEIACGLVVVGGVLLASTQSRRAPVPTRSNKDEVAALR